jgi:hypothetical protein
MFTEWAILLTETTVSHFLRESHQLLVRINISNPIPEVWIPAKTPPPLKSVE